MISGIISRKQSVEASDILPAAAKRVSMLSWASSLIRPLQIIQYNFAFYWKIRIFWFRKRNPFVGADCQCFCPSSHNTVSSRKIFWKGPFSFSWRLHSCRGLAFICRFNGLISIRTSNYTVTNRNTILLSIFGTINFFYVKLNIDAVKWLHLRGINYRYSSPVSLAQILHSYTVTI